MSDVLSLWTIYRRPKDYPDCIVARRYEIRIHSACIRGPAAIATADVITDQHIDDVRQAVNDRGFSTVLPRSPDDDPVIVETWI